MTDLRTRIAKALYGQILSPVPPFDDQPDEVQAAWLADANAVIRELGLTEEHSEWPFDGKHRYVTEWSDDK